MLSNANVEVPKGVDKKTHETMLKNVRQKLSRIRFVFEDDSLANLIDNDYKFENLKVGEQIFKNYSEVFKANV